MGSNAVKAKQRLQVIEGQLELLAERLATLPARISPGPIYKQMERLESEKRQQQQKASEEKPIDRPAALSDFSSFVKSLGEFENADAQAKFKILQALVQKIETTPNGFRLHHYVGAEYFNGAGATPRPATRPTNISRSESGSNSLTIGVPTGIRTPVPTVKR